MTKHSTDPSSWKLWLWSWALIGVFLTANLTLPSLFRFVGQGALEGILHSFLLGVSISEVVLLGIWAVLGTDAVTQRFGRVLLLLALGWFAWMAGVSANDKQPIPWQVGLVFAIFVLLLFLVVTGSVYAYRSFTGQVLRFRNDLRRLPSRVVQFSIKQILGWTAGVASALVVARLLFDIGDIGAPRFWRDVVDVLGLALLNCVLITIVTAICLELALGRDSKIKWIGVLVAAVATASILSTVVQQLTVARSAFRLVELLANWTVFFTSLSTMTTFVLARVRWIGFRLVKVADIEPAADVSVGS